MMAGVRRTPMKFAIAVLIACTLPPPSPIALARAACTAKVEQLGFFGGARTAAIQDCMVSLQ